MLKAVAIAVLLLACSGWSASAETNAERCRRENYANVDYKKCLFDATKAQSKDLADAACSPKRCAYKLACVVGGNDLVTCKGSGYVVTRKFGSTGSDITIRDPSGGITKKELCGTCSDMGHISGPLRKAEIRPLGDGILLQIPK